MAGAPIPDDEDARLRLLEDLGVLDTSPEEAFDRLTALASRLLETPLALVSFLDRDRQWCKSRVGLDVPEMSREHAFCAHAIVADLRGSDGVFEVRDALTDERFADNPLVKGAPHVRFYAGAPLRLDGRALGTLCVLDPAPRALSAPQRALLRELALVVVDRLALRRCAINERRHAEQLALAGELAQVGFWRADLMAERVQWSEQTYRIHGLDARRDEPPTPEALAERYVPEDRPLIHQIVQDAIERGAPFDVTLRLRASEGLRSVRTVGRSEPDPVTGKARAVFGAVQDVTEAQQLAERLRLAEKMASLGTLAAGVAHEVNNPLSYVLANAEAAARELERPTAPDEVARQRELAAMLADIRDGARRIEKIVRGLKMFSRDGESKVQRVSLRGALETAARLCQNELKHRARFALEVPDGLPPVEADESQLVQVAVNLVVNAAQAIPLGAAADNEVFLCAGLVEGAEEVYFEVRDTGEGMSEEVVRRAFSPFFTTKPVGVGTGLGLAICDGIVQALGGRIEVASAPGEGTRMRVVLPAAEGKAAARPQTVVPPPDDASTPRARVLVIDDERVVARALSRVLVEHDVQLESDPERALARIRAGEAFDAVLCDLNMPTMSGAELHGALAQAGHPLARKLAVVTGGAFSAEGKAFVERGAVPVVDKPIDVRRLRDLVRALVDAG